MTLQQLQYVVAVAEHGHFGRAAEACHVTQPTLTMGVRKLEDELDVVLFDRGRHPVRPTEDGRRIVEQARVVLRESEGLQDIVRELHGGIAGRYRVGIIPTLAPYLLPRFLPGFAEAHPEVQLVLDERRTTRILKALTRGT
ncbi:MAG TPA: LysR family transcriptional regulator, partial [Flavobacteriales bacterium]|nr:LysR family transcriptional regulator [Flavobacteriales bacterium]